MNSKKNSVPSTFHQIHLSTIELGDRINKELFSSVDNNNCYMMFQMLEDVLFDEICINLKIRIYTNLGEFEKRKKQ